MKLKYHLLIALGLIIAALFLTSIISTTVVPALMIDKESTTTIWNLMWENLFTNIPTNEMTETLVGLGLPETLATSLIEEHGTGNSVLSGLLGLLPILGVLAGIAGVVFLVVKENLIKWLLYTSFGFVFVSVWTIWFTAPTKLTGIESMYNSLNAINPAFPETMGTMMKNGTEFSMGIGLLIATIGSLYGIVVLVLNQLNKIEV